MMPARPARPTARPTLSSIAYGLARRVPPSARQALQTRVERSRLFRAGVHRLTTRMRSGSHTITAGPAAGMKIDVAGSRPGYVLGTAEPDVQSFMLEWIQDGDVVFDLGANVGYFTLCAAALVGARGAVVAYEPSPSNVQALRHNVLLNNLDERVTVVEAAVSAYAGTASFDPSENDQSGRLAEAGAVTVSTVRLDEEIDRLGLKPSFVKIDVEGAELDALRGMRATLENARPMVLCEIHAFPNLEDPVPRLLVECGYQVEWLAGDIDGTDHWAPHLVAVPSDSPR